MENRIESAAVPETDDAATINHSSAVGRDTAGTLPAHRCGGETRWAVGLSTLAAPRFAFALIGAVGALLYLANLGGYPLYTKGEPREAVTVLDIVRGGGVILPMRAGVEVPSKPLLMHWIAALISLAAGGVSEWTVRLPSALLAILGMGACYWYVRRLFDNRSALFAALMLGTTAQYLQAGGGCRVDMTLTFFMEVGFFEFVMIAEGLRVSTAPLYLAMALAVLTKGPIGAALPVLVAALWIALMGRWDLVRRLQLLRGALIVGVIGGGWYLAAVAVGGMPFVHKQILAENLYRLVPHGGVNEGHAHSFYYEEGTLLVGFMPWTPIVFLAAIQYFRRPRRINARLGYLLTWFAAVLIFYNLPQSKRGVYLLALYPALSALTAILICDAIVRDNAIARLSAIMTRTAGAVFLLAGIGGLVGLAMLRFDRAPLISIFAADSILVKELPSAIAARVAACEPVSILLPIATAAFGAYLIATRPRIGKMATGILGGFVAIALAARLVVEPAIAHTLSLRGFTARAVKIAGAQGFGYFGSIDYAFAFYSGGELKITWLRGPDVPALIVAPENDWKLLPSRVRDRYAILMRSNPTDLDGTGRMLLLQRYTPPPTPVTSVPSAPNPAIDL
ncbi:MAG TPA: glycosyltransferase family 39 protein [Candidatus Binataceae bacterium]|nr:glycosyltransferase family 39 protein [Candidatus Binataceae bacterium]